MPGTEALPGSSAMGIAIRKALVRWLLAATAGLCGLAPSGALGRDPEVPSGSRSVGGGMWKPGKRGAPSQEPATADPSPRAAELLGTLAHLHTGEHLLLSAREPTDPRFTELLSDHVTRAARVVDPRLLGLVRRLAVLYPGARFEIVSGYRSEKLNEARRKKGRHVASHSQHSLGQALDFRVVPRGETRGLDPRRLEREIRELGWDGGVGVYTSASDWFVHADVGKHRRWRN